MLIAEDSAFFDHDGIDYEELREVDGGELRERGEFSRGASTITQQLAKNLYLSPSRNPVRKFRELLITRLLEGALHQAAHPRDLPERRSSGATASTAPKRRRARTSACRRRRSRAEQSALLAGSLINPRRYSPGSPPRRLLRAAADHPAPACAWQVDRSRPRRRRASAKPYARPRTEQEPPAELETLDEDPERHAG